MNTVFKQNRNSRYRIYSHIITYMNFEVTFQDLSASCISKQYTNSMLIKKCKSKHNHQFRTKSQNTNTKQSRHIMI